MKTSRHYQPTSKEYINPLANRFDKLAKKSRKDGFARTAYVLQGGGSIGSYQMGVLEGLLGAGYEPDWISATSIGAIQASIVVGNKPKNRIPRLREFWERVSTFSPFDIVGQESSTEDIYNKLSSTASVMFGQRGFFNPRWSSPALQVHGNPSTISFYDTSPLRQTLLDLIDFDLLNSCPIRLSLGSVGVNTGRLIYFNNINYLIKPEHIMASGALPPGFPAIEIAGQYYWDGGIHSNTPLEVILDADPPADTLCFVVDCFGGSPFVPTTLDGICERIKDIEYSTHARRSINHHISKQNLLLKLQEVYKKSDKTHQKMLGELLATETPHRQSIAHITYSSRFHRGSSKDYNFGQVSVFKRAEAGYKDAMAMLAEVDQWGKLEPTDGCKFYEAPNNLAKPMESI